MISKSLIPFLRYLVEEYYANPNLSKDWFENVTSLYWNDFSVCRNGVNFVKSDRPVSKSSSVNEFHTQFSCKINIPGGNWTTCKDLRITLSIKQIVCYSIAIICDDSSFSENSIQTTVLRIWKVQSWFMMITKWHPLWEKKTVKKIMEFFPFVKSIRSLKVFSLVFFT